MPPKGSKRKAATPESEDSSPPPKKLSTPAKAKGNSKKEPGTPGRKPTIYTSLKHENGAAIPVDVTFEGDAVQAKANKSGKFGHVLKLEASRAFSLTKTVVLQDGPYEGQQAIIILPARAFPFLKLPEAVRDRIYKIYFAQKGVLNEVISFDGKRPASKEPYAKTYAEGSKSRVGLLVANKQIYAEALQYLFAPGFRFESTATVVEFFSQIPADKRQLIRKIEIKTYVKSSARTAWNFLVEVPLLERVHLDSGVHTNDQEISKAAKNFMNDASKFLEAAGIARGNKAAAVDILSFGRLALSYKEGDKKGPLPWPTAQVDKFRAELRKKLQ